MLTESISSLKCYTKQKLGIRRWMRLKEKLTGFEIYNPEFDATQSIFIHVPKTAGTSIGLALYQNGSTGHYRWWEYKDCNTQKFDAYFKFAFIRHPVDRFISSFYYLKGGGKTLSDKKWSDNNLKKFDTYGQLLNEMLENDKLRSHVLSWGHFEPQSNFICNQNGKIMVDFIGRFETIDRDFNLICHRINSTAKLDRYNTTKTRTKHAEANHDSVKAIESIYHMDFKVFYSK
jgi:hypothetical protein